MDIQRLRNLTTGKLHTSMAHIYKDIDYLTGESGVMSHMIPHALWSMEPWLRKYVPAQRFWNNEYDPSHIGDIDMPVMTAEERAEFFQLFKAGPSLLAGKDVIEVHL